MFDSLLCWIKEIFILGLISEIFISLIQHEKYKKYVNYITGLMIICICLKMVYSILNIDISEKMLSDFEQNLISGDAHISSDISAAEYEGNNVYISCYINANIEYIEKYAKEYGLLVTNADIRLNDTDIEIIEIYVTGNDDIEKCMEFKKFLTDIYNIDSSNIRVYWRENESSGKYIE